MLRGLLAELGQQQCAGRLAIGRDSLLEDSRLGLLVGQFVGQVEFGLLAVVADASEDLSVKWLAFLGAADHHGVVVIEALVIRRAQEGQPLNGKILTGIGHDSQKTAFELANELADQQVQAKIIQQGIPADGKSARELLLAKMNIKRDAQRGAEHSS